MTWLYFTSEYELNRLVATFCNHISRRSNLPHVSGHCVQWNFRYVL